jgi:hypothetical protein
MSMSLFETALQRLNDDEERKQFNEWERAAIEASKDEFKHAARTVVDNIRLEEHFDDHDPNRPEVFTVFLRELAQNFSTSGSTGPTAKACYKAVCQLFCLHGKLINAVKPKILFRYIPMNGLLGRIAKMIDDDDILSRRRKDDVRRKNDFDLYRTRIFSEWEEYGRKIFAEVSLSKRESVFVTFPDADGRIPDGSIGAVMLMHGLGHLMTETDSVVKFAYETQAEDVIHFPTVADAEWYPYFKPAPQGEPHGWTEPIDDPTKKGYPEAVHPNRKIGQLFERPQIIE